MGLIRVAGITHANGKNDSVFTTAKHAQML